jgi:lipopolysaccharide export LptBFGC system permease protein LptF
VLAEMESAVVNTLGDSAARSSFRRPFSMPMPEEGLKLSNWTAADFLRDRELPERDVLRLKRELIRISNQILAEMNSRASFAVACLILVMVGCSLGILFKSGNFLTAFAVSVVPALLSILLIVTGQHTCENVPYAISANYHNPLPIGLAMVWAGNVAVLVIAVTLLTKLQRQ